MGFRYLGASSRKFLNGNEGLSFPSLHNVPGRAFAQAGNGHKGRQDLAILNQKFRRMALINVNGCKIIATQIKLVHHFQGRQQIFVLGGGLFIVINGLDIGQRLFHATHHQRRIKATLLTAAVEIGRIERQRMIYFEPRNTESHHTVRHRMGLGEQILDLFTGKNIPIRHTGGNHFLLRSGGQTFALTNRLHDLKGTLIRHAAGNQVDHNIVTGANGLIHRGSFGIDQILCVAQPHVGAMGIATDTHQKIKLLRQCIQQNATGESGVKFRYAHSAGGTQQLIVFIAQDLGACENGHRSLVIQRNGFRIHPGHILHHADHGGIIMSQHIQLQKIFFHGVIFKMGGDLVTVGVICRVLHRTEIPNLILLRNNHQAAGMLAGGTPHAHTAGSQAGLFRFRGGFPPFLHILFDITEGSFFCHSTNGTGTEHMGCAKHGNTVFMGLCLILTGEIQVNIGHLVAAEAKEGFKRNVKTILFHPCAAYGTVHIRQVSAAVKFLRYIQNGVLTFRIRATVMGREGINLRDAGHESHNGGTNGATGAHQIAVFKAVLHQALGRHINHVIMAGDNIMQLRFHTIYKEFGRVITVQAVKLAVNQTFQVFHRVFDLGGKQVMGHRTNGLAHIGDHIGIFDHNFVSLFFSQIGKFLQHFVRGTEIQGVRLVRIIKALGCQQDMAENLVFRIEEMNIAGSNHRFPQFLAQPNHGTIQISQIFLRVDIDLLIFKHETVIGNGLYFQIIVERGDTLQLIFSLFLQNCLEQLTGFTGRANDQTLPHGHQLGLGNPGHTTEIMQIGVGNQVIQISQTDLVLGKEDNMSCLPFLDLSAGTQALHHGIDLLKSMDLVLFFQFVHQSGHNQATSKCIICGPMVAEFRQAQGVGHNVQLEFAQMLQQILGQDQRIHRSKAIVNSLAGTFRPDKSCIKIRIMGHQHTIANKFNEFRQNFLDARCTLQHIVRNTRQFHNFSVQLPAGIYKGLEAVNFLAVLHDNGADFNDAIGFGRQAGGFQVKGYKFLIKRHLLLTVNHNAIIHIVDIVAFTAIEDLNGFIGACHLGWAFPILDHMQCIGKRLAAAVICDSNGFMSPSCRLLNGRLGGSQGIHVTHGGVQM